MVVKSLRQMGCALSVQAEPFTLSQTENTSAQVVESRGTTFSLINMQAFTASWYLARSETQSLFSKVLLEQQTGLIPREIMTDTAGASDMIFGLFWLLGYQFSPRLADAGEATLWRIDKEADYGVLDDLVRNCIKPQRFETQWDEMLRVAGSLKLGTVSASELIRSLLKSDRPSALAQAIIELGRSNITL